MATIPGEPTTVASQIREYNELMKHGRRPNNGGGENEDEN